MVEKSIPDLLDELRDCLSSEADTKVADPDRMDTILRQLDAAVARIPACALKMKPGEVGFTLRSQDLSAPATVDFWQLANRWLRQAIAHGMSPQSAATELRYRAHLRFPDHELCDVEAGSPLMDKLAGAIHTAELMENWPYRKVAD